MRSVFRAAAFLLFCCLMSLDAAAAVLLDPMDDYSNRSYVKYSFLTRNTESVLASMTDTTALSCLGTLDYGWVEYSVTGAERITLELYSQYGTFVTHDPSLDQYVMGSAHGEVAGRMVARAVYNPASERVYMRYDGKSYLAKLDQVDSYIYFTDFSPTGDAPGDVIGYGATVFAYAPGSAWTPLTLTNEPVSFMPGTQYFSEILTAAVPPGATMIRVILSGSGKFPSPMPYTETEVEMTLKYSNALASVKLEGASLAYGVPPPVATRPPPGEPPEEPLEEPTDEPDEEPPRSSSRASSRSAAPASRASSKASSSPSSKFTGVIEPAVPGGGVKFSGVITSPAAKEGQTQPPREPSVEEQPYKQPLERASTAPLTYEQPSAVVYQVDGGTAAGARESNTSAWIIGYSVVLTGAILAVLLKNRRNK